MSIYGAAVGLGKRLKWPDNYFNLNANISYNYYDLNNYNAFIIKTGFSNDLNLGINISRNSIDAPIYPKSGSSFLIHCQFTPPYSLLNGKDYSTLSNAERYRFIEYQKYKIKI